MFNQLFKIIIQVSQKNKIKLLFKFIATTQASNEFSYFHDMMD